MSCTKHSWVLPKKGKDIGDGIVVRRARCERCGKEWGKP